MTCATLIMCARVSDPGKTGGIRKGDLLLGAESGAGGEQAVQCNKQTRWGWEGDLRRPQGVRASLKILCLNSTHPLFVFLFFLAPAPASDFCVKPERYG